MNNAVTPAQRKGNVRLAWFLASLAVLLFVGFIVKSAIFGI
ncbi:MAG: cytochrome oxidase small assembly protein [Burkholderiaceae bacterium]